MGNTPLAFEDAVSVKEYKKGINLKKDRRGLETKLKQQILFQAM